MRTYTFYIVKKVLLNKGMATCTSYAYIELFFKTGIQATKQHLTTNKGTINYYLPEGQ